MVGPAPLAGPDLHQLLGVSGAAFRSNSIIIHVGKTMGLWKNSPSALHINQFFDFKGVLIFFLKIRVTTNGPWFDKINSDKDPFLNPLILFFVSLINSV